MNAFSAIYTLILRSIASRGRLLSLGGLGVISIVIGYAVGAGTGSSSDGAEFINRMGLTVLVPITTLVFATAALGDIIDDGTMVYLWLRPVKRFHLVTAAAAATLTVVLPLVVVPLGIAAALTNRGSEVVVGAVLSSVLGVIAYTGLFVLLGVVARRSLIWGLLYILIWEGFVAEAGRTASRLAIRAYTRSILSDVALAAPQKPLKLANVSSFYSYAVPIAVFVAALALAVRRLQRQDVA